MSSFLGKVRNLFDRQTQPSEAGALMKVYGRSLENPDALINRANKRAVGGDVDGAIEDFNTAIHLNPGKATAYFNRGYLYNTVGRYQLAVDDFSEAIQLLPDYDEAYFQRGISRARLGDSQGAVVDYGEALRINPYSIKVYYQRAELLEQQRDLQGALADYSQAILRVPKDANAYYRRGALLAQMGEPSTAIADFTLAIEYNPKHADAYFQRGRCYAQLGQTAEAQADFNQALLFDPTRTAQYQRPSGTLQPPSTLEAAAPVPMVVDEPVPLRPLKAALMTEELPAPVLDPSEQLEMPSASSSITDYFERAQVRAETGDLDGAIADYSVIIEQEPDNSQAYYHRSQSRRELGETDTAIADLDQALHWARRHSLSQLKDFSGALENTLQTLKQDSEQPRVSKTQSLEETVAALSQTIADHPEDAQAYFERGKRRAMLGDLEGAIADYTETLRLDPSHSEAYYNRGRNRSLLGDTQGATDDLNHAIRQTPITPAQRPKALSPSGHLKPIACNHAGNLPHNKFCIHCGASITPTQSRPALQPGPVASTSDSANATNPEVLYQQGVALAKAGEIGKGLQALANALPLFLEQHNLSRYQETMALMQRLSKDVSLS